MQQCCETLSNLCKWRLFTLQTLVIYVSRAVPKGRLYGQLPDAENSLVPAQNVASSEPLWRSPVQFSAFHRLWFSLVRKDYWKCRTRKGYKCCDFNISQCLLPDIIFSWMPRKESASEDGPWRTLVEAVRNSSCVREDNVRDMHPADDINQELTTLFAFTEWLAVLTLERTESKAGLNNI
jgi:hypothetical protein